MGLEEILSKMEENSLTLAILIIAFGVIYAQIVSIKRPQITHKIAQKIGKKRHKNDMNSGQNDTTGDEKQGKV